MSCPCPAGCGGQTDTEGVECQDCQRFTRYWRNAGCGCPVCWVIARPATVSSVVQRRLTGPGKFCPSHSMWSTTYDDQGRWALTVQASSDASKMVVWRDPANPARCAVVDVHVAERSEPVARFGEDGRYQPLQEACQGLDTWARHCRAFIAAGSEAELAAMLECELPSPQEQKTTIWPQPARQPRPAHPRVLNPFCPRCAPTVAAAWWVLLWTVFGVVLMLLLF